MRKIYNDIVTACYTADSKLDAPLSIIPPTSELARTPYFVLSESLTRVRVAKHACCLLMLRRSDLEGVQCPMNHSLCTQILQSQRLPRLKSGCRR
jgi:hypothetical protein